jgi:hypothetical protein
MTLNGCLLIAYLAGVVIACVLCGLLTDDRARCDPDGHLGAGSLMIAIVWPFAAALAVVFLVLWLPYYCGRKARRK